ncbi:RNA recognition motif domain [Macleaya cordata]|uniref:RNA recognition motif domain n=1 Tax=Macleaya cordata TaxID=56857 RepID=A0A200QQX1_MACCD|nr:RNA recognition motif domain [Macleaya cordata]
MRTRNSETPKSVPTKKTVAKKTPNKTPPKPSEASTNSTTPKSASSTGPKPKTGAAAKQTTPKSVSKPEPKVEDASKSVETVEVKPEAKAAPVAKSAVKKSPGKTAKSPAAAKAASTKTTKSVVKPVVEQSPKKDGAVVKNVGESSKKETPVISNVESPKKEENAVLKVVESPKKDKIEISKVVESPKKDKTEIINVVESPEKEDPAIAEVAESSKEEIEPVEMEEEEEGARQAEEELEAADDTKEPEDNLVNMEEDAKESEKGKEVELQKDEENADEGMEDYSEREGFEEPGDEECAEDDVTEPEEGAGKLEIEQMEISAIANERKIKKELEIFVGGLDRDAVEDDVKKVFEKIGEVVEVRLHRNHLTNKNKGFAFVKFAQKEQASKALSELKNPVIRGKRCGVTPCEDNDTLFVGNICNTWTREAIKQKLKEYGVEGVENVTLVPDAQHEGLSRGFAFVEFSCHADATLAYKRLQKPDVVFGHTERTVKVAFAEPLREPDPEIMAQVKSVFVDGLPPHWNEERVREHFKGYGEIERIVLARNMHTAKRKDFGFVDFTTHEAATACIDGVHNTELGDGKSKMKVKVRLASPLPKTQAVKGGLSGGFRIGRAASGTSSRFGRGFGRGGRPFNRVNFQPSRGFYGRGRGRAGRFAFEGNDDLESTYYEFRGRRPFGGRGGRRGSGEEFTSRADTSSGRPDLGWPRHGASDRGHGNAFHSRRQPFSPEGHFSRPFGGRHFIDDPYLYTDDGHGIKRPFSAMDHEPGYLEPSRLRPRFDYPDPLVSSSSTRYQDSYGAGAGLYSHDYYGSDMPNMLLRNYGPLS